MAVRKSLAVWEGSLREGKGMMRIGSGVFEGSYSFASRFEDGSGTNPEELIAAAHAGCFSMALSAELGKAGFAPKVIQTTANVYLEKIDDKQTISRIHLETEAEIPDIDEENFRKIAEGAKSGCPVSRALASVEISLNANLRS
ncbi:MAG: OsmC family protein [Anaerolineales bacterium]|nr:OsmC family protein [Anaerolineales bacterium]